MKHCCVCAWVWPNTNDYEIIAKDVPFDEGHRLMNDWMSKSRNHDAMLVDEDKLFAISDKL